MATVQNPKRGRKSLQDGFQDCLSVPLNEIEIVSRPQEGCEHEQLFYNPRFASRITPESLHSLVLSIRTDGLLQLPVCRYDQNEVSQLLAGERRVRALRMIVEEDFPCYHRSLKRPNKWVANTTVLVRGRFAKVNSQEGETVVVEYVDTDCKESETVPVDWLLPTISGKELYEYVSVNNLGHVSDEEALRISMTENMKNESLTVAEEVSAVERLVRRGLSQKEIVYCLGMNITWVSQTASFRKELPPEAFEMLMDGRMKRHVAVRFFSYRSEDREQLLESSIKVEEHETAEKIRRHQLAMERFEDEEDLQKDIAVEATAVGDEKTAAKAEKKAGSAAKKASVAKKKRDTAKKEAGAITQTHVDKAASQGGIVPRKTKTLGRSDIEKLYIDDIDGLIASKALDPLCNKKLPVDLLSVMQATARAIVEGNRDPISVVREYMVQAGKWEIPDEDDDEDEELECDDDDEVDEEDDEAYYDEDDEDDDYEDIESVTKGRFDDDDAWG